MTEADNNEIWRPFPLDGFSHLYEVSNHGRVRKIKTNKNGPFKAGYVLKPKIMKSGHLYVCPSNGAGIQRTFLIHRAVAIAFIGPPPDGMECCHGDGNPKNNHVSNLRWDTRRNNIADAKRHGTHNKGAKNGGAKLNDEIVCEMRKRRSQGAPLREIATLFGSKISTVSQILNRKSWTHIP